MSSDDLWVELIPALPMVGVNPKSTTPMMISKQLPNGQRQAVLIVNLSALVREELKKLLEVKHDTT